MKSRDLVLQALQEQGVEFVRLWFTDITGTMKSISLAPAEVESAFNEGIGFDGSSIEGLTRVSESDLLLFPDASTFRIFHVDDEPLTARMFCNIHTPNGEASLTDPRQVLRRQIERAEQLGFQFYTHPEIEFYIFASDDYRGVGSGQMLGGREAVLRHVFGGAGPIPVDSAGYFDSAPAGISRDFRWRSVKRLEDLGVSVEFSHHESGPGQNEIDLRYSDALTTADNIMTVRAVLKEVAAAQGVHVSFMPKPLANFPGSGMHTHLSLFEGERNVFYDPAAKYQMSQTARRFIAGLLRHAREITAVTNQYVNSYKRIWGGDEAPSFICWGHNNSSALVRVPLHKPGKVGSARVEYRALDSGANPYLAYAVLLAAGLKGIEEEYELDEEVVGDVWALTDIERRASGIASLPTSLEQAIELCAQSELVAETLGEQVFSYYLRDKSKSVEEYRRQVTVWELDELFRTL